MKLSQIGQQCRKKQKQNPGSSQGKKKKPAAKVMNKQNVVSSTGKKMKQRCLAELPFCPPNPCQSAKELLSAEKKWVCRCHFVGEAQEE